MTSRLRWRLRPPPLSLEQTFRGAQRYIYLGVPSDADDRRSHLIPWCWGIAASPPHEQIETSDHGRSATRYAEGSAGRIADRTVSRAAEQGADEAFGLAVGAGPVGPGAEVFDPERPAGDRVDRRAVGGAVVGQHRFDADAVAGEVRDRARRKPIAVAAFSSASTST